MKNFLSGIFGRRNRTHVNAASVSARSGRRCRPSMERLEDRTVPATIITILDSGVGTLDGFLSPTDGTITAADNAGVAGTLSRAALQGVGPTVNVVIQAENSFVVNNLTSPLALQTPAGKIATFDAQIGSFTFTDTSDSFSTAGGDFTLNAPTMATLGGITAIGGTITIRADNASLNQTISAGATGVVSILPTFNFVDIDLGGPDAAGVLGLTNAELNDVFANVVRIGASTLTGNITITDDISIVSFTNLSLETTGAGFITQEIGDTLTVGGLAVQSPNSINLVEDNDVNSFAGAVTGALTELRFDDTDGFVVDIIDGVAGLSATVVTLGVDGAVTQAAGAKIVADGLRLFGAGSYALTEPTNDIDTFAANTTSSITYVNAGTFDVGNVFGATGVVTANSNISLSTIKGSIVVLDTLGGADVDAGNGSVFINAGSIGDDHGLDIRANAGVTGTGGVSLKADNIAISAAVNAGTNTARIEPHEAGTLINLGNGNTVNTLGILPADLNFVTAGVVVIGNATAGTITVKGAITPAGTNQLELETGANVVNNVSTIAVTRLGITAGAVIGAVLNPLNVSVNNLEAFTTQGGIFIDNTGPALTIGGVNSTLSGVKTDQNSIVITNNNVITIGATSTEGISIAGVTGSITVSTSSSNINVNAPVTNNSPTGNVTLTAEDDVNVTQPISTTGNGSISVTAEPGSGAGTFTSSALGTLTTNDGDIKIQAADNVNVGAAIFAGGSGNITVIADPTTGVSAAAGNFSNSGSGTLTTNNGNIKIQAGDSINPGAAITAGGTGGITIDADAAIDNIGGFTSSLTGTLATSGGPITITAFDIDLGGTINATTAITANVTLQPRQTGAVISLGADTGFGLTDADLDKITARFITIGNGVNTGGIQVTDQVTIDPAQVLTLVLNSFGVGGKITDNTATDQTDISAQNLLMITDSGIGDIGGIEIAVTNLAAQNINLSAGTITIFNDSPVLNITAVANDFTTVFGVFNNNAVTGTGPIVITSTGAMNVNESVVAAGVNDISLNTGTSFSLGANEVIASGDGVTGGNIVVLTNVASVNGTEDITLNAGADVLTKGDITINADPDGNGVGGGITMLATSTLAAPTGGLANNITLRAGEDISLSTLAANGVVDVTTSASITDDGDDTTFISGASINLKAGGNIGGTTQIGRDDVLFQNTTFKQAIDFRTLIGILTITQTGAGGNIQLRQVDGAFDSGMFGGTYPTPVGVGNQLALIASGGAIGGTAAGNLSVSNDLTLAAVNNVNLLLAATDGNDVFVGVGGFGKVTNNGATGTVTAVSAGGGGVNTNQSITSVGSINLTSASIIDGVAIGANITATGSGSSIVVDSGYQIDIVSATAVVSTSDAAGGGITFTSARNLPNFITAGFGAISMANGSTISTAANNSPIVLNSGAVIGDGNEITLATVTAGTGDVNIRAFDGAILDNNGAGTTNVTGGKVNLQSETPAGIDSDVEAATSITVLTSNDPIVLRSLATMPIALVDGGTANVSLSAGGAATGIIKSATPNDNVADVVGDTVTLSASGTSNGNIGQIGFFSGTAQFFEINANVLSASTNNSRLWISEVGSGASAGMSINNVVAGSNTAFLRVRNGGSILSANVNDVADVIAATVNLSAPEGGSFGTGAASPLEINATNLTANVQTAAGSINVLDTTGGLSVTLAQTVNGAINLATKGTTANLAITNVNAGGANNVALISADDVTIGAASSVTAGGTIAAAIDVGNTDAGVGATANVAGTISATSMTLAGNSDSDVFNVTPSATTPISVDGNNPVPPALPGDSLNVNITGATGLTFTKTGSANGFAGSYAFTNRQTVSYQEIESLSPDGVDLSILMTDNPDPVVVGQTITYTITVNIGGSEGQNVQVLDAIPANTTFVSLVAPAGWTIVTPPVGGTGNVTATRATLAGGSAAQVFTLIVRVNGNTANNTIINNSATVNSSNNELNPGNNSVATTTTVKSVLLPVVVGAGGGGGSHVKVFDPVTGAEVRSFFAYPNFGGGVQVAAGDVNGDGIADVVTGAGAGGGPHVKAFDGVTGSEIRSFFAYDASFTGGVYVAVGDVNGDGVGDIITGAGAGGGPHVQAFSGVDGSLLSSFFAYDASFAGGVRVAAGFFEGDTKADIITGAGAGGGPHVTVRSGNDSSLLRSFFAYDASVTTGVYVAGGDLNNDGVSDIITGTGEGSSPHTLVYSGKDGSILQNFLAYDPSFTGGVRVAVADFGGDGQLDLVTGAGPGGGPQVKVLRGTNLDLLSSFFAYDPSFLGGVFVG